MRSFVLLVLSFALAVQSVFAGYGFSRSLTIDKTKVPNSNQTNFPVMACFNGAAAPCNNAGLVVANLKTVGNGGKVTNSSGFDIAFASDVGCTSLLNWEMEFYSATTGEVDAWVKLGTVSTSVNTVFYLCYANAAISTFQGNVNGTWNSAFKGIWHWPNGSTVTDTDSTSNANNFTANAGVSASAGQIDGGITGTTINSFPGQPIAYNAGTSSTLALQAPLTFTSWVNRVSAVAGAILSKADDITAHGYEFELCGVAGFPCYAYFNGALQGFYTGTTGVGTGAWHQVSMVWAAGNVRFYVDGAQTDSIVTAGGTITYSADSFLVGAQIQGPVWVGFLDEIHVSNVDRGSDWIATEYNNQSAPTTFYTVGAETQLASGRVLLLGVG
jgi:hypothetical protein